MILPTSWMRNMSSKPVLIAAKAVRAKCVKGHIYLASDATAILTHC